MNQPPYEPGNPETPEGAPGPEQRSEPRSEPPGPPDLNGPFGGQQAPAAPAFPDEPDEETTRYAPRPPAAGGFGPPTGLPPAPPPGQSYSRPPVSPPPAGQPPVGQPPAAPPPGYGAPGGQPAPYGQPAFGQQPPPPSYGQPGPAQQPPPYGQPGPAQQPPPYGQQPFGQQPFGQQPPPYGQQPPAYGYAPPPPAGYGYGTGGPVPPLQPGQAFDPASGLVLPEGVALASLGRRVGSYFLGILLAIVTLGIGYVVWGLIIWSRGQTPAMQVLKMRCWRPETQQKATWGWMALREVVGGIATGILGIITELTSLILMLTTSQRKCLADYIAGTVVLHDPNDVLADRA